MLPQKTEGEAPALLLSKGDRRSHERATLTHQQPSRIYRSTFPLRSTSRFNLIQIRRSKNKTRIRLHSAKVQKPDLTSSQDCISSSECACCVHFSCCIRLACLTACEDLFRASLCHNTRLPRLMKRLPSHQTRDGAVIPNCD